MKAEWTIMFYIYSVDHSIKYAKKLLKALAAIGSRKDMNIVIQFYRNWNDTEHPVDYRAMRFHVQKDVVPHPTNALLDLGNVDMGEAETMAEYLYWAKNEYPAEKYMLVLWSHGMGVGVFEGELEPEEDEIVLPKYTGVLSHQGRILENDLSTLTLDRRHSPNYRITREALIYKTSDINKLSLDDDDDDESPGAFIITPTSHRLPEVYNNHYKVLKEKQISFLSHEKLRMALKAVFSKRRGDKLDILAYNACCMQMMETGYQFREYCRYLVASEETIYFDGLNYPEFLAQLADNPDITAEAMSYKMIETFSAQYPKYQHDYLTMSMVDLKISSKTAQYISEFAEELFDHVERYAPAIKAARYKCKHFGWKYFNSYIDINWWLTNFYEHLPKKDPMIKKSQRLIERVNPGYVLAAFNGEKRKPIPSLERSYGANGLSIYFPISERDHADNQEFVRLFFNQERAEAYDFVLDTMWDDFVFKYLDYADKYL
ncbi:hypothetical protein COR50_04070 [Chitinophaga caeni]|uniref:Clostripain family protein n=1 Tax=Chitinophaga caeni TaxID=2029983 RepID=A0A291QR56_9BACT|nr:clostripain-related cysteine peptidase [Chitinophaga caeni]ATL46416.1 hypothetical protein COR50_04070 [Chitinophaga caeni]